MLAKTFFTFQDHINISSSGDDSDSSSRQEQQQQQQQQQQPTTRQRHSSGSSLAAALESTCWITMVNNRSKRYQDIIKFPQKTSS